MCVSNCSGFSSSRKRVFLVISCLFGDLCFSVCKHVEPLQWLPAWEAPSLLEGQLGLFPAVEGTSCIGLWLEMPSHSLVHSRAYSFLLRSHSMHSGWSIHFCDFFSERDYLILCLQISLGVGHTTIWICVSWTLIVFGFFCWSGGYLLQIGRIVCTSFSFFLKEPSFLPSLVEERAVYEMQLQKGSLFLDLQLIKEVSLGSCFWKICGEASEYLFFSGSFFWKFICWTRLKTLLSFRLFFHCFPWLKTAGELKVCAVVSPFPRSRIWPETNSIPSSFLSWTFCLQSSKPGSLSLVVAQFRSILLVEMVPLWSSVSGLS